MADETGQPATVALGVTEDQARQLCAVQKQGEAFLALIRGFGISRELSVATTKIEEAVMWTAKHLTR